MKRHAEGLLWFASFGCLYAAALTSSKAYLPVIAVVWAVTTGTVVPLHFIRAWRKRGAVPNKTQYAAWVGFETICAVALVCGVRLRNGFTLTRFLFSDDRIVSAIARLRHLKCSGRKLHERSSRWSPESGMAQPRHPKATST
jgi:hypothetical protein